MRHSSTVRDYGNSVKCRRRGHGLLLLGSRMSTRTFGDVQGVIGLWFAERSNFECRLARSSTACVD